MTMRYTRNDSKMVHEIHKLLNENSAVSGGTEPERREKRIVVITKLFEILSTTQGKTFVHKHEKFQKVLLEKLDEFRNEIPDLVSKWRHEIFDCGFQLPEPGPEPEPEPEDAYEEYSDTGSCGCDGCTSNKVEETEDSDEDECYCDQCFHDWVDKLKYDAVFTRERLAFLSDVWNILLDMDNALNDIDFQGYNIEMYNILCTDKGRRMLEVFPKFRSEMEGIIYELAINDVREWKVYWLDVFGCDIDDARYWVH